MNNFSFGQINMGNRRKIFKQNKEEVSEEVVQEEEKKIHEHINEKNANGIYDCIICCEEFKKEDILFPCIISKNHTICESCFEVWKSSCCKQYKEVTCPICRTLIPKNGTYTYYYENGLVRQEVNYLNDIPHGLVQLWTPEGIIQKKFYTKDNKYHGLCEDYDLNGYLLKRVNYDNNTLDGLFEEYYPFEILKVRCYYKSGSISGNYQLFYNSSLLFIECECGPIGGKINGFFKVYNQEGDLIENYICKNGRINIHFDENLNVSYSIKSGNFEPMSL